jgi:CheY-like chemotaxis protein
MLSEKLNFKNMNELSVLIAEDERINFRLLERLLCGLVKKVDHAVNGQAAIELAAENSYDLVFMDMQMPIMGGLEATRILKNLHPGIKVIAQSAFAIPEEMTKMSEAGCDDLLTKPISRDRLMWVLQKYSGIRRENS